MNLRVLLISVVLGFMGLLLAMGALAFVRWLKRFYPRRFRLILGSLGLLIAAAGALVVTELMDEPTFSPNDLVTLHEPVVAHTLAVARDSRVTACIIDGSEHLAVLEVSGGTLIVHVESNNRSDDVYCAVGTDVQIEQARLHRYTVTRR